MNEFDENSHQEINDENFYEYQIRSKKEISQLKDELNVLKTQYDEAMNFTSKIEEFSEENKKLKKQLLDIRLSNDDLARRLQISQQTISDLTKENEKIKLNANNSCCNEITDLQTQLGIAKTENINICSRFQNQISELKSSLYSFESENAVLKKQQQKMLHVVGQYFNQVYQNSEDLCNSLIELKNKSLKPVSEVKEKVETLNLDTKKDEKLQHFKSKYQAEKDKRKDLQMSILKIKKKLEQQSLEQEEELTKYKDKIIQQSNEIKRLQLLNQQKMLPTGPRPPELKSVGCQIILSSLDESEQISSFKQQVAKANSQIDAQDSSISILRSHNDSLIQQLETSKMSKDQISSKLKQLTTKYNELEHELKQQKKENVVLNEKLNQKNKSDTNPTNSASQYELKIKLINEELQNKQKSIDSLENLFNDQKNEIISLSANKEKMISIIEKQNEMLNFFNNEILSQKADEKKLKVVEKVVAVEPKFEWNVGNVPDEIKDIIHDITGNESMSIESRIKSVFIIINKWISQNINSKENGLTELNQQYEDLSNEYNEFKNQIVSILELNESNKTNNSIINTIIQLYDELEKYKNEMNEVNQLHEQIFELTEVNDFDSIIEKLKNLTTDNQQLVEKIEIEVKKRKSLKKQYIVYLSEKEKEVASLKDLIHSTKENSKKQISNLQKTINELQTQNGTLIERIKELLQVPQQQQPTEIQTDDINFFFQKDESTIVKNKPENDIVNKNNDVDELSITQSNLEKEELQDQVKNLEMSLKSWKEAVNQARDENSQFVQQLNEAKQKYENKLNQIQKKHEIEILNQNKTIKELSNQMKRKEEDHQVVINRLNMTIQHSNKLYEESLQKLSNLTYSFENEKKAIESRIETIERAKKLSEAQLKAKILSLDSNYAILIEEEKQKGETEKRELIEFFAKTFRNFADINFELNEESFHEMVLLLKSKFDKQQRSEDAIRKLIKANNNESIEESITQYIIQNHPQLQKKPH